MWGFIGGHLFAAQAPHDTSEARPTAFLIGHSPGRLGEFRFRNRVRPPAQFVRVCPPLPATSAPAGSAAGASSATVAAATSAAPGA